MSAFDAQASEEHRADASRVAWVDYAKGWCIVLVVTMHSTLGVGLAVGETGWLHHVVAFAKPFRMPDFFLVAGLFVSRALDWPWRRFLDRKVLHFAYFYGLWLLIVLVAKAPTLGIAAPGAFVATYLWSWVEPFSTLWFIHLLPLLFLAARLTRAVPSPILLAGAVALHLAAAAAPGGDRYTMASHLTGWTTPDAFALFAVYFLVGVRARAAVFAFAEVAARHQARTLAGLAAWLALHAGAVSLGLSEVAGLSLALGLGGALAVVAASALLARGALLTGLAYVGRHSIAVYLAFVVPMGLARTALLSSGLASDVGWASLAVTTVAIVVPLLLRALVAGTRLGFLFDRPSWARLHEPGASPHASLR